MSCKSVCSYRQQSGNKKSGCPAAVITLFSAGWSGTPNTTCTWWQRIRRANRSRRPCPSGRPQSQMPSQVPSRWSLALNSKLKTSSKTAEPNSKLKKQSVAFYFLNSLALNGEWQLNKSTEKIKYISWMAASQKWFSGCIFCLLKVLTARAKWAWVCARRTGTGSSHRGWNDLLWITVVFL